MREETILIADDDKDLVELLARHARLLGLQVETAADGETAFEIIRQRRPNVAILDIEMPGENGLTIRDRMNEDTELVSIPVIILTGKSDRQTIFHCHHSCAYYIPKCPEVWSHIEPLLCELLTIEPKPSDSKSEGNDLSSSNPTSCTTPESAPSPQIVESVDYMISLLGGKGPHLELDNETSYTTPKIDRPWILCIDDDTDFSFGLKIRLARHGIDVLRAFDGREGYRYAFTSQAEAIILDYQMPEGNGDYVLRRLKESPATNTIPVIVLTGHRDRSLERTMYNLGADEFLTKPCPWENLWAALQRHIRLRVC